MSEANTIVAAARARPGRLLAVLGVAFGIAVTVGNTIGSGILRTPGEVAAQLPSAWLFLGVWLLGGLYALLGANALAELAAMTPESGGYTVFVRRALGPFPGFAVGWSDWLSTCTSAALAAIVIGEYTGELVPPLATHGRALAAASVAVFALLQWRGVRIASVTQELTTALKAGGLLALVGACFLLGGDAAPAAAPAPAVPAGAALLAAFVLAMQSVIFTYDGFSGPSYFAGEIRNAGRDIPRSIFGGVAAVIAIYVLLNAAFLYVLPLGVMAGDTFVAGRAAGALFGPRGDSLIQALVVLSLLSALNAYVLIASRVFYGVSASGIFPAGAAVNRGGTPAPALLASAGIVLAFVVTGTFQKVVAVTAFFFVANYTLTFLSVFVLRRREPDAPRPFRARAHPWSTGVVLVGSLAFLGAAVAADSRNSLAALGLLAVSWPLFRLLRARRSG
ncbi:MAG: APC family permease [Gemmatimonadetes bacterium]|nr:APC family permease [Gemmatimonadota bacterium]